MNIVRELRLAARALLKRPGFSSVAVVTLAMGIGANVAIFSVVNAILLRPLPYPDSDEIIEIRHHAPGLNLHELQSSEGMVAFYRASADYLDAFTAFDTRSANLSGGDQPARVPMVNTTPELFTALRTQPMLGRPFGDADAGPESAPVAILTYDTWIARFGSDQGVLGSTLELDGIPTEIVGVMPRGFAFPDDEVEVLAPLYVDPDGPFGTFGIRTIARVAPGITVETARIRTQELQSRVPDFFEELEAEFLEGAAWAVSVESLQDRMVADIRSTLWIIVGTMGFVLLIACANVANLFLVRAESRSMEMAVRAAMGAGKRSVAASFLSESLLLGFGGGAVGVLLAWVGVDALASAGASELPRLSEVSIDAASLGLAGLLSIVAAGAFGTLPMTRYAGRRFAAILRDGGRGNTTGKERNRARSLLVASQLALGLVLLVGSGLMLRSFAQLRAVELGIEPQGVLTVGMNRNEGEDPTIAARFYESAADRVAALPGVESVGITTNLPLASGGSNGGSFFIESQPRTDDELPPVAMYRAVGLAYFGSLGVPLVRGRDVERADSEESMSVVWVNETFERSFLGGDALGERIRFGEDTEWAEVVGVVGDVREFDLTDEMRPNAYFPLGARGPSGLRIESAYLTVEMVDGQDPASIASGVQAAIRELDSRIPITVPRTMSDILSEAMASTSFATVLLGIATVMALFLGAIGLAGVISYVVGQRTREIGVRVALGAHPRDVSSMILRQSMVVIASGTVLGLIGALGLTRLMRAVLFEVSTTDPITFVVAPVLLVCISLLATWWPVRRAARVDPMEALRSE